jgi:ketosteroid isomerase-like protein
LRREILRRRCRRRTWRRCAEPTTPSIDATGLPGSTRGAEAVWNRFVGDSDTWEEGPYEHVEVIDAGNEQVVAHQRREMRGKASGADVIWSYWVVVTFRNGKALRIEYFVDRADALEAAGLTE